MPRGAPKLIVVPAVMAALVAAESVTLLPETAVTVAPTGIPAPVTD